MNREEINYFKEWLRDWNFDLYDTMPIRKKERDYLVELFDQIDNERKKKHEWYLENKEEHNSRMKDYYQKRKAQAFIKGAKHD